MASTRAKLSKYGDRLLETIESTIKEFYKTDKNSSSSNDSNDSVKRRDSSGASNGYAEEDDGFTKSTGQSKKMVSKLQNKHTEFHNSGEKDNNQCLDDDLDFEDGCYDLETNGQWVSNRGREEWCRKSATLMTLELS